jgi:hypothetical protein
MTIQSLVSQPVGSFTTMLLSPALAVWARVVLQMPSVADASSCEASVRPDSTASTPAASSKAPIPLGQVFITFLPLH